MDSKILECYYTVITDKYIKSFGDSFHVATGLFMLLVFIESEYNSAPVDTYISLN
jgi:hypothetical protein